jgi:hypothetical protein
MSTCAHCGIVRVHITLFFQCKEKIQKNVGNIPWEKFREHSALVPSKFPYKYNLGFFLRKIGVLLWMFRGIN